MVINRKNIFIITALVLALSFLSLAEPNDTNTAEPDSPMGKGDLFNNEFAPILERYVGQDGLVNYAKLYRHRIQLKAILVQIHLLERISYESWTKNEKKAFWVNVYNLCLLDIIIQNYPINSKRFRRLWWPPESIRHIQPLGTIGTPKWNRFKYIVMDEEFTLLEIENRFFRNQFRDPRIFMALHRASLGGPPLRNKPFYGKSLDKQLDEQAQKYLNSPVGVDIKQNKDKVYISVLFKKELPWFGGEFADVYSIDRKFKSHPANIRAVLNFISKYLPSNKISYLETGNYKVQLKSYDWRLNEK